MQVWVCRQRGVLVGAAGQGTGGETGSPAGAAGAGRQAARAAGRQAAAGGACLPLRNAASVACRCCLVSSPCRLATGMWRDASLPSAGAGRGGGSTSAAVPGHSATHSHTHAPPRPAPPPPHTYTAPLPCPSGHAPPCTAPPCPTHCTALYRTAPVSFRRCWKFMNTSARCTPSAWMLRLHSPRPDTNKHADTCL